MIGGWSSPDLGKGKDDVGGARGGCVKVAAALNKGTGGGSV